MRKMDVDFVWELSDEIQLAGKKITSQAEEDTALLIREGIIQRTKTYILDEAESLGAEIQVISIKLIDDGYLPVQVELKGEIAPYHREVLSEMLQDELGISEEGQIWME